MPPAGFELTNPASERPQTHTLCCAVTAIGMHIYKGRVKKIIFYIQGEEIVLIRSHKQ
jgi:hypothetical protein